MLSWGSSHQVHADELPRPGVAPRATDAVRATVINAGQIRAAVLMTTAGIFPLIIGLLTKISFVWSLGVVVVVIALVLWSFGAIGHAVRGPRHYL